MDRGDVDIDTPNRELALQCLTYVPASIIRDGKITKHNTGVYFHAVPIDPVSDLCSISYDRAESIGCFKIDILNVGVYQMVRDEAHLLELMNKKLDWKVFQDQELVSKLFHLGNHAELVSKLDIKSKLDIAMTLALIRPGKRHLQYKCIQRGFDSIKNEIWTPDDNGYVFKKSHSISYAVLIYVHANLLLEQNHLTPELFVV